MSDASTEEKKHPASDTKLHQLRQRGQVPVASDFRGFLSLLIALSILIAAIPWIRSGLAGLLQGLLTADRMQLSSQESISSAFREPLVLATFGFMLLILVVGFVAAIIDSKGLVVSPKAFTEAFSRINPVSNVKERFSLRTTAELGKALALTIVFLAGVGTIIQPFFGELFQSPLCGAGCVQSISAIIAYRIALFVIALLILAALADYLISHGFFLKQNRMTDTELKRENKDNQGSPEVRQRLREIRNEILESPSTRPFDANIVVYSNNRFYMISYTTGQPGPPYIANIFDSKNPEMDISALAKNGKTVIQSEAAAMALANARRGEEIPDEAFDAVATVLRAAGLA